MKDWEGTEAPDIVVRAIAKVLLSVDVVSLKAGEGPLEAFDQRLKELDG